jgi:hypothetical protein
MLILSAAYISGGAQGGAPRRDNDSDGDPRFFEGSGANGSIRSAMLAADLAEGRLWASGMA